MEKDKYFSKEGRSSKPTEMEHIDLPVLKKERVKEIAAPEITEQKITVPHVQYIERIEEVPTIRRISKTVPVPQVEVTERIIEIPKPVKEEKIVTVPHLQVVDRIVEVPKYITKEKTVEQAKIIFQERIIPIPKRTIEEKVVEVPDEEYDKIMQETVNTLTPTFQVTGILPPKKDENAKYQKSGNRPVDEVIVVPHIQHVYRNVVEPVFRHVPKPFNVPVTHYSPVPVEHIVDRNVPIPVELETTQEFLCPRIIAKYVEVPVPIAVTRSIEKPVPVDALFNSVIMDAYFDKDYNDNTKFSCTSSCKSNPHTIPVERMDASKLTELGLNRSLSISDVLPFKSRGFTRDHVNMDSFRSFLFQKRTLRK